MFAREIALSKLSSRGSAVEAAPIMIAQWSQGSIILAIALIALASLILGWAACDGGVYRSASLTAPALAGILADHCRSTGGGNLRSGQGWLCLLWLKAPMLPNWPRDAGRGGGTDGGDAVRDCACDASGNRGSWPCWTTFLLTAHLIVFWLSQDSNVTPPVCLAAFTAAGIAGSKPMATGFQSWKIAKGLYIVPLMFAYTPLISGEWYEVMEIGFFGLFGIYATNALIQFYAEGPLNLLTVPLLIVGAAGGILAAQPAGQYRWGYA